MRGKKMFSDKINRKKHFCKEVPSGHKNFPFGKNSSVGQGGPTEIRSTRLMKTQHNSTL